MNSNNKYFLLTPDCGWNEVQFGLEVRAQNWQIILSQKTHDPRYATAISVTPAEFLCNKRRIELAKCRGFSWLIDMAQAVCDGEKITPNEVIAKHLARGGEIVIGNNYGDLFT